VPHPARAGEPRERPHQRLVFPSNAGVAAGIIRRWCASATRPRVLSDAQAQSEAGSDRLYTSERVSCESTSHNE